MQGRFLGGVLIGGMIGAAMAANWDSLKQNCPVLREVTKYKKSAAAQPKTRLMARRHRVKKEYCC